MVDPFTLLGLGALAVLALRKRSASTEEPQQSKPPTAPVGTQSPGGGGTVGDVVGGVTAGIGAVGAVVGALKTAGVFAGGTAGVTAAGTGGTVAASSGGTAAASGGTAAATASGVTASAVGASVGAAAIIIAIEAAIMYGIVMASETSDAWSKWSGRNPQARAAGLWFLAEQDFVEAIVEPSSRVDPATGKAVNLPGYVTAREYVNQLDEGGFTVATYVPSKIDLPAFEVQRLYRCARYLAYRKMRAYNAAQFWFYAKGWNDPARFNPRGVHPDDFEAWARDVCANDPWGHQLQFRDRAGLGTLEAAARSLLTPNFDLTVATHEFRGRVMALTDAAVTGYPWLTWPGDEAFSRSVVAMSNVGGAPHVGGIFTGKAGPWPVDEYYVGGGRKWVAVDPATGFGLDIQGSRSAHSAKVYSPETLQLGTTQRPKPSEAKPAVPDFGTVATVSPTLSLASTSTRSYAR
jgi:hypothetical protein